MAHDTLERIIIDGSSPDDARCLVASRIFLNKGGGSLGFKFADVVKNGVRLQAMEANAFAERQAIVDAVREAGFQVLENVERVPLAQ